jgi:Fic family protein
VLVKAALVHVQFETIHPFLDGNGRVGRLLIAFLLCSAGVLREPILYLSLYFKENRRAYYELLDRVRVNGDWEAWLDFFLIGVRDTAEQATSAARRILDIFDRDRRKVEILGRPATSALRVFEYLQRNPICSVRTISRELGISVPTVTKSLEHLHQLDVVQETTGRRRDRLFVYAEYMAILNEGTEPLR